MSEAGPATRGFRWLAIATLLPALAAWAGLPALAAAESPAPAIASAAAPGRPRLALVLSGGGARGAAHIGVLKILEEMHIPVDMVVGTSMGSIVGGLYATGWSPAEIEQLLREIVWKEVFIDQVERQEKSFRRKQDDTTFLVPTRLRFKGFKPYLPQSFLGGQRLELLFRSLEIRSTGESDFDRFPIPYRAVAADLQSGDAVILDHGSLATAMRASMSVAGMFAPVQLDGRSLVDGGAAANLPVGIAQQLGGTNVIAVDITSPLYDEEHIGSLFSILGQMSSFVTYGNRMEDLRRLRDGDVLVQPQLGDITFSAFDRAEEAITLGEAAARAEAADLRRYSVDDATWAAFLARHHRRPVEETVVDKVQLVNTSLVDDDIVEHRLRVPTGKPFDADSFRDTIMRLYSLDYFGIIRDDLDHQDGAGTLHVTTPGKPYGRNSAQFGVSFLQDSDGDNSWALAIRHLLLAANRRGGEWENVFQIGDTLQYRSEFYQPFDSGMAWFVAPWVQARREGLTIWQDGQAISEFEINREEAHVEGGRVFGDWGEFRFGPFYSYERGSVRVGQPTDEGYTEHDGGLRYQFRVDTRDTSVFPRHGTGIEARYVQALESAGSDANRRQAYLAAGIAMTKGRVTILPGFEITDNIEGPSTVDSLGKIGGFLRLSGLAQNEILAERTGLARLLAYFELSRFNLGALSQSVFAGISLETGGAFERGAPVTRDALRYAGSIYVGAKTVIGPVFLGYGVADGGSSRIYFNIGQRF
jgi:NTE family protein